MHLCRFQLSGGPARIGLVIEENQVVDLSAIGVNQMRPLLETDGVMARLPHFANLGLPRYSVAQVKLLSPLEQQEVWAAGVTYLRSKAARMDESAQSANLYDRVYDAERPELFFKSSPDKVVPTGEPIGVRRDSKWTVPEPELGLVLNSRGDLVGYTVANDVSARDIEGDNLLYLPQAKIYHRSCALGPWIRTWVTESNAREWDISLVIQREKATVFSQSISIGQIKRSFSELAKTLFRCQTFPHGVVLLTGTGIVPPNEFSLQADDTVTISISGIGAITNTAVEV